MTPRRNSLSERAGPRAKTANACRVRSYAQPLEAALGQKTLDRMTSEMPVTGLPLVAIITPTPSLPDPMVIADCWCSLFVQASRSTVICAIPLVAKLQFP